MFLIDFIFSEILSHRELEQIKKIHYLKTKSLEKYLKKGFDYMCFVLFLFIFNEELFFRLLPALFILAITRNLIFLGIVLVISALIDAFLHRFSIESILEKANIEINEDVLDLYTLMVFCLQIVLAFTFYFVLTQTLVISFPTAIVSAFLVTLIVHFLYDFIIILLSYESLREASK